MCDAERIRYTISRHTQLLDDHSNEELAGEFTEGGVWETVGGTHVGRAAIVDYLESWPATEQQLKHLTTDSIIDLGPGGDTATAVSNYIVVYGTASGGVIHRAGRYLDILRKEGDGWRFVRRTNSGTSWVADWKPLTS
jgi:ketosteroid isomerase-like protein